MGGKQPEEFDTCMQTWRRDAVHTLLQTVWRGYVRLSTEIANAGGLTGAEENLERGITERLAHHIRNEMSASMAVELEHEPKEEATRAKAPAQPPEYDLAFRALADPRVMFPLEAKVMHTDTTVAEYAKEVRGNYLTGRYAPFANDGGMLGYLIKGNVDNAFDAIEKSLRVTLLMTSERRQRMSEHVRNIPVRKILGAPFRCHHLIMVVGKTSKP